MEEFKFEIGQTVELKLSCERGEVTGRAEYRAKEPSYYVCYLAGDGRQVEAWIGQSSLK